MFWNSVHTWRDIHRNNHIIRRTSHEIRRFDIRKYTSNTVRGLNPHRSCCDGYSKEHWQHNMMLGETLCNIGRAHIIRRAMRSTAVVVHLACAKPAATSPLQYEQHSRATYEHACTAESIKRDSVLLGMFFSLVGTHTLSNRYARVSVVCANA